MMRIPLTAVMISWNAKKLTFASDLVRLRLIASVFHEPELGDHMRVAVVAALVEEKGFLLLREGHPELNHERRDECHKGRLEGG